MGVTAKATLALPGLFRDIAAALAGIGRSLVLSMKADQFLMYVVDAKLTFQVWVTLTAVFATRDGIDIATSNDEALELRGDNFMRAFRNIQTIDLVELRVKTRPGDARLLTVTTQIETYDGVITSKVHQRIPARLLQPDDILSEPEVPRSVLWGEPSLDQLPQMLRVCEQYRGMDSLIRITISRVGELTLSAFNSEVEATTAWRVGLADVLDDDQNSLARDDVAEVSCFVNTKDWSAVLGTHTFIRRFIVGIVDGVGLAAYGYMRPNTQTDYLSFYLVAVA